MAIAAPAVQHAALTEVALAAGKHVYVEKPLALDVVDAERRCDEADAAGRVLMVGHLLQYHPAFLALARAGARRRLGRLEYLYSNRLNLGRFRREENILWSFAPHDISMILSLVGTEPSHVDAVGSFPLHRRIADVTTTHLEFPDGEQAHVFVSWLHPFKEQKLVVVGDQGMAVFDDGEPWVSKLVVFPHRVDWRDGLPEPVRADAEAVHLKAGEPLEHECRHFLECVATGATPRTDGREGLRVLRVLQAAEQAIEARSGHPRRGAGAGSAPSIEGVMIHESAYVDEPSEIGAGTRDLALQPRPRGQPRRARLQHRPERRDRPQRDDRRGLPDPEQRQRLRGRDARRPRVLRAELRLHQRPQPARRVQPPRRVARSRTSGNGATIGANATIVCGHDIGEYAFVAAGAVVASEVPAFGLMVGVPARRVGWMSHAGERLGADLVCPRTGRRYRETTPDHLEEIVE